MGAVPADPAVLRRALELAVAVAREVRRSKAGVAVPVGLQRYLAMERLPATALGPVRRAVEADEAFRTALAQVATADLVDPIGLLWLARPDGWEEEVDRLLAAQAVADQEEEAAAALRREQKRRARAEDVAVRARTELVGVQARLGELRAAHDAALSRLGQAESEIAGLRADLATVRTQLRHALDRGEAAQRRAESLAAAATGSTAAPVSTASGSGAEPDAREPDAALADRADAAALRAEVVTAARAAAALAERLERLRDELDGPRETGTAAARAPIPIPGAAAADPLRRAAHLLRVGAVVFVDGYNVAMTGWPEADLAQQRTALIGMCENLARRFGTEICVVFDGADLAGAQGRERRVVRVVYSAGGRIADDTIRAEVDLLPADRPAVAVTDDRALQVDLQRRGVTILRPATFLAIGRG